MAYRLSANLVDGGMMKQLSMPEVHTTEWGATCLR
jgi:hypothetical protein